MRKDKIRRLSAAVMRRVFGTLPEKLRFEGHLHTVAILAQEKIGDAILLTPLLKNLRQAFPEVKIHIVAFGAIAGFFECDTNVDVVHQAKGRALGFLSEVRKIRFDVLFNTKDHPSWTFLMHTALIRSHYKVGIDHPYHRGLFNYLIKVGFEQHIVQKNCALLTHLGVHLAPGACRPYIPQGDISPEVAAFVSNNAEKSIVGINLSAGEPSREWPIEKWQKLVENLKVPIVVFAMPNRVADKATLEESFSHVLKSPQTKTIYDVAAILQGLTLLISPDTALIHMASCYNRPVVGLYRADVIHLTRFAPYEVPNRQVVSEISSIKAIPVQSVLETIHELCPHIMIA